MLSAQEVKAMNIKKVVDDAEWQALRKSLIGNWVNNHEENVKNLRAYYDKYPECPLATRRLINVLTGSVHRVGRTKGQDSTDALRRDVRIRWRNMLGESFDPNDYKYRTGAI